MTTYYSRHSVLSTDFESLGWWETRHRDVTSRHIIIIIILYNIIFGEWYRIELINKNNIIVSRAAQWPPPASSTRHTLYARISYSSDAVVWELYGACRLHDEIPPPPMRLLKFGRRTPPPSPPSPPTTTARTSTTTTTTTATTSDRARCDNSRKLAVCFPRLRIPRAHRTQRGRRAGGLCVLAWVQRRRNRTVGDYTSSCLRYIILYCPHGGFHDSNTRWWVRRRTTDIHSSLRWDVARGVPRIHFEHT